MTRPETPAVSFAAGRSGMLRRKCACGKAAGPTGGCEECKKKRESGAMLQRKSGQASAHTQTSTQAPSIVHEVLRSPGQPLDAASRAFMEPRFGYDFSRVRVHADSRAAKSAEAVNAQAYTVGSNIVFGANQGGAGNLSHQRLLAHELTHVVQQGGRQTGGSLQVAPANDSTEGVADIAADRVLSGGQASDFVGHRPLAHESTDPTQHQAGSATTLQRQPKEAPVQGPGICDPKQLSSLGPQYRMTVDDTKADKQKQGLKEMHLGKAPAKDKDFVLFCPHIPSARLRSLVPCTSVFVIGSNRPPGKVDVWAQQPGETEMFWGFVNESLISKEVPSECVPGKSPAPANQSPDAPANQSPDAPANQSSDDDGPHYGQTASCPQWFLEKYLWPAADMALKMTRNARVNFIMGEKNAVTQAKNYFGKDYKDYRERIIEKYEEIRDFLQDTHYTYDCVDDCTNKENDTVYGYTKPHWNRKKIYLCLNTIPGNKNTRGVADLIIHEASHLAADTDDPDGDSSFCDPSDSAKATNQAECYASYASQLWEG